MKNNEGSIKGWKIRVLEAKEHVPSRGYVELVINALKEAKHDDLANDRGITQKIYNTMSLRSCSDLRIVAAIETVAEANQIPG